VVDLFEDDYLLLPAADLRMDHALRPCPVSSVTSGSLHNLTTHRDFFICTWNSLFLFLWPGAVRGSAKEGTIVCTIETQ
jgi:hypothetical protein